jgi:hypothetical protein
LKAEDVRVTIKVLFDFVEPKAYPLGIEVN